MARVYIKIGDVFSVKMDLYGKKFFQLIAYDLTQLNSDVIRAFKTVYPANENPDLLEIVEAENRKAEIGVIVTPYDIVDRMKTGKYDFVYPGFE